MSEDVAVIIGAGPAGLTAAKELQERTRYKPLIFEMSDAIGGISRTVNYRGNRMDIGGHRFFSKSDRVMNWWCSVLPIERTLADTTQIAYQGRQRAVGTSAAGPDPDREDAVMLVRRRVSRILYQRKFYAYPISLDTQTLRNLGPMRLARVGASYLRASAAPIRDERSLEDFLINRFGRELYLTFFKDYTEKVWGISCDRIPAEWGAQRIKGLSISSALAHALRSTFRARDASIGQKSTETTLIERFLYPKFGPGQMWETVARNVVQKGGEIRHGWKAVGFETSANDITSVQFQHVATGELRNERAALVFSTMPVQDLVTAFGNRAPDSVQTVARGLMYRDFITVGLLLRKLRVQDRSRGAAGLIQDNWIYVQEPDVRVGRLQVFNNWSPYLVRNPEHVWLGLEYFCNEGDELWSKPDSQFIAFAIEELVKIGFIAADDVLDATLVRVPKTYPAYFGSYDRFGEIRSFTDHFRNLYLVGRNGMHKYNNADHSMLTAMVAVDNIQQGSADKANIWAVNTEQEYHEEGKNAAAESVGSGGARVPVHGDAGGVGAADH